MSLLPPQVRLGLKLLMVLRISRVVALLPLQVGELKPALQEACPGCGLSQHDGDAQFCKRWGTALSSQAAGPSPRWGQSQDRLGRDPENLQC
ncbi:hypothetical protein [Synechococcus sp. R65.1]|uniref:hypothetical protein n=1 Tax=unclassified Synechococcus TaxID=2626047 RepID=UPI0039C33027